MPFNSINFFIFFAIVYLIYLSLSSNFRSQNRMLLIASYFFYGFWDWRFLSLIFISTVTDYFCGIQIDKHNKEKDKKKFVAISVLVNLSILGFFKYFNFFIDNFVAFFSMFGIDLNIRTLNIILPVGISFYTFQTLSYTIDVYRKQVEHCTNFLDYALYVSFFPQLVAGPIERGKHLLPQLLKPRTINSSKISEGLILIYWGLFKKLFIADNLGLIVDDIYSGIGPSSGGLVYVGMCTFSFQVYADFSAYTDIARGVAKLMGFQIMENFRMPFFASNIQQLWQRWHMSLTSWIRDYIYYPLAFKRIWNRWSINVKLLTIITYVIMGLWHGAAWNFVIWGGYHGTILALYVLLLPKIKMYMQPKKELAKIILKASGIILVFHIFSFGNIFFRSQSFEQVASMTYYLFANFDVTMNMIQLLGKLLLYVLPLLLVEIIQLRHKDLTFIFQYPRIIRYAFYSIIFYVTAMHSVQTESFVYFQF